MKTSQFVLTSILLSLSAATHAAPFGTAFTYQGRLTDGTNPANGLYDINFSLHAAPSGGPALALWEADDVLVTNGLFTVIIDFGAGVFTGEARWLELAVRTTGAGAFSPLNPRQPVSPTPYAIAATELAATLPDSRLSSNVALLASSPTFTGTVTAGGDFEGSRLNIGSINNLTGFFASIAGGISNTNAGALAFVGGGQFNSIQAGSATIGGGGRNLIQAGGDWGTIAGGELNTVNALRATIGGGRENTNQAILASIGGGLQNAIQTGAHRGTIGGGERNRIEVNASYSSIGGGEANLVASTEYGTIGGGGQNANLSANGTIGGGFGNTIQSDAVSATIGGGRGNTVLTRTSVVGGGEFNRAGILTNLLENESSTVAGGNFNSAVGPFSAVGGGYNNHAIGQGSVIGGGGILGISTNFFSSDGNRAEGTGAVVPGGAGNEANGRFSFAAGVRANALHDGTFVWADFPNPAEHFQSTAPNQFLIRAGGGVGINISNPVHTVHVGRTLGIATINFAGRRSAIENAATNGRAALLALAGPGSQVSDDRVESQLEADHSGRRGVVGTASAHPLEIRTANASRLHITTNGNVGIGNNNPAARLHVTSTAANPADNTATFTAAGIGPNASHVHYGSAGDWYIRSAFNGGKVILQDTGGRVGIGTASPVFTFEVNGTCHRTDNSPNWDVASDRRLKRDIAPLTNSLATVEQLRPVRFLYTEAYAREHSGCVDKERFGVVAQEFRKVFPDYVTEGTDGMLSVDISPLTFHNTAAIRELHELVKQKDAEIEDLKRRLTELEGLVRQRSGHGARP